MSDNTDVLSRSLIQEGTSYGYPLSRMSNHISAVPNHQTTRISRLEDRLNVASFGVLVVQLNPDTLSVGEKQKLKSFIASYKSEHCLLQYGTFYRLEDGFSDNYCSWITVDSEKNIAKLIVGLKISMPALGSKIIKLKGLDDNKNYRIKCDSIEFCIYASGEMLRDYGLILPPNNQCNERNNNARHMVDFSTIVLISTPKYRHI